MKTIEEFIEEIRNSAALQNELNAVKDKDELAELMKKNGCEAAVEEFVRVLSAEPEAEGEISDNSAESAAGGIHSGVKIVREIEAKSDLEYRKHLAQLEAQGLIHSDET